MRNKRRWNKEEERIRVLGIEREKKVRRGGLGIRRRKKFLFFSRCMKDNKKTGGDEGQKKKRRGESKERERHA